ncbi:MAG: hypothetical protein LH609_00070 [Rudanella sp.]|nr:hypothetical protein [Rudanella sp.]
MKQLLFGFGLTLLLAALMADEPASKLNGAFRQTKNKYGSMTEWKPRDSVTVVKVFRDGYWIGAFYDDKRAGRPSFNGACGALTPSKTANTLRQSGSTPGIRRRWATCFRSTTR